MSPLVGFFCICGAVFLLHWITFGLSFIFPKLLRHYRVNFKAQARATKAAFKGDLDEVKKYIRDNE